MKKFFYCTILLASIHAQEKNTATGQTPAVSAQQNELDDDDIDGQVVLQNVASMLASLGTITTDPQNPVVLGPGLAQIGISFINIIAQIFKNMPEADEVTREHIALYFNNLPDQTKYELVQLVIEYALACRNGFTDLQN